MSFKRKVIACVMVCITALIVEFPVKITNGYSMFPTISDHENVIGVRFHRQLKRGDVVTGLQLGKDGVDHVIKRVIGLPGDCVKFRGGELYVNGNKVEEDYLLEAMKPDEWVKQVPDNCIFVMGDNRNDSFDSRFTDCMVISNVDCLVVYNLTKREWVN